MTNFLGYLVEFINKNRIVLGLVQNSKKQRLRLLTTHDRQITVPQGRILHITPSNISPNSSRDTLIQYLRQEEIKRKEIANNINVTELWELVHREKETFPLTDLTELVFNQPICPKLVAALLRALFNERLHFKLVSNTFEPLSVEKLQQKKQQQKHEANNQAEINAAINYLKNLPISGPYPPPKPNLVKLLSDLVVFEKNASQIKKAKEITSLVELNSKRKIFDLLVRLKVYTPHQNLVLLREGYTNNFTQEALTQAANLDSNKALTNDRENLTKLYTFTIDSNFTTDFDDALSFTPDKTGGGQLGIHITDAAALLPKESALDLEARSRGCSIYLPDTRIPMLPPTISENILSLREGITKPALSCLIKLNSEGKILNWRLTRSTLKVDHCLTYDKVDKSLITDQRFNALYILTQSIRNQRTLTGAYYLPLPEIIIGVDENSQVWIKRIDHNDPSRNMVAETAILANQLKARFLVEQDIPALFRIQAPTREPLITNDPNNLYLHFKQRRLLNRVVLSVEPGLHAMLGIIPYTHVTSPIRRYLDLIMQRQIVAVLTEQKPPYDTKELRKLAQIIEFNIHRGIKIRQARQRYWLQNWLQGHQNEPMPALVIERQSQCWQLLLTEVMLLTSISNKKNPKLELGQEIMVKILKVDPFYDILKVTLI